MKLINRKIINVGNSFYINIPRSLIEIGVINKNKTFVVDIKEVDDFE